MLTTWPRLTERPVMTPALGAGTVTSDTIWLGCRERLDLRPAQPQQQQPLARGGDFRLMAGMEGGDLFQLLTAHGTDGDEFLRALELLVIGREHGTHGEVLRLRLRQLRTEQRGQRGAALDGGSQLHVGPWSQCPRQARRLSPPGRHRPSPSPGPAR